MSRCDVQGRRAVDRLPTRDLVGVVAGDDHDVVAEILRQADFVPMRFDDVEALMDVAAPACPDVTVLCLHDQLSITHHLIEPLVKQFPLMAVVVACEGVQRRGVRTALAAGAVGIVTYDALQDRLVPCLRAVCVGQICVPREYGDQVEPPVLSTREKQILGLVVMGYMNSEIAAQLFLAESTVKSHLSSAFGKLGVHSRNEAVDLIVNPERGLGMGILGLEGEPLDAAVASAS